VFEAEDGRVVGLHRNVGERHDKQLDTMCCIVVEREYGQMGLPRDLVTPDLWCREVPLEGCSPCPGPIPRSSVRT
jgi:hypothetical protein